MAFFALLYFGALRPSEALALRVQDCELPETGWGRVVLSGSRPEVGKAWTDNGERTEDRELKWRATKEVRPVPIPPEMVRILREHIAMYGSGANGRLFRTALGGDFTRSAYSRAWSKAREYALTPDVVGSPVAGRPYDLRHAGVTMWLNSGMPRPRAPGEQVTGSTCCYGSMPAASTAPSRQRTSGWRRHSPSANKTVAGR